MKLSLNHSLSLVAAVVPFVAGIIGAKRITHYLNVNQGFG